MRAATALLSVMDGLRYDRAVQNGDVQHVPLRRPQRSYHVPTGTDCEGPEVEFATKMRIVGRRRASTVGIII